MFVEVDRSKEVYENLGCLGKDETDERVFFPLSTTKTPGHYIWIKPKKIFKNVDKKANWLGASVPKQ